MRWSIDHGDCREVLRDVADDSLDACVTDPPYELGFMGKKWDGSGVAFQVETWAEILRVLKPGAYLLAFGGARTYHRLACAIEDAGFEVRDSIHWIYGSGMPKSKTVLKPGHEPAILARKPLDGTLSENVSTWGTGRINIDANRIGVGDFVPGGGKSRRGFGGVYGDGEAPQNAKSHNNGRWPSNVVVDDGVASELGEQARYFYVAKASPRERNTGCAIGNNHPTVKPVELMRHLLRLVVPSGGIVLDPFCGSGSTGVAALAEGMRFAGIEQSAEYLTIARQRLEHADREAA